MQLRAAIRYEANVSVMSSRLLPANEIKFGVARKLFLLCAGRRLSLQFRLMDLGFLLCPFYVANISRAVPKVLFRMLLAAAGVQMCSVVP